MVPKVGVQAGIAESDHSSSNSLLTGTSVDKL